MSREGYVSEGSGDNVFIVKNGVIRTPHPAAGILNGVTRKTIIDLARSKGSQVEEALLNRYELYTADEIFLTGTGAEIIPVVEIDSRVIGNGTPGPVSRQTRKEYLELVRSEGYQF